MAIHGLRESAGRPSRLSEHRNCTNAVCGPQVNGTKKPDDMTSSGALAALNPCPLNGKYVHSPRNTSLTRRTDCHPSLLQHLGTVRHYQRILHQFIEYYWSSRYRSCRRERLHSELWDRYHPERGAFEPIRRRVLRSFQCRSRLPCHGGERYTHLIDHPYALRIRPYLEGLQCMPSQA